MVPVHHWEVLGTLSQQRCLLCNHCELTGLGASWVALDAHHCTSLEGTGDRLHTLLRLLSTDTVVCKVLLINHDLQNSTIRLQVDEKERTGCLPPADDPTTDTYWALPVW